MTACDALSLLQEAANAVKALPAGVKVLSIDIDKSQRDYAVSILVAGNDLHRIMTEAFPKVNEEREPPKEDTYSPGQLVQRCVFPLGCVQCIAYERLLDESMLDDKEAV